MFSQETAGFAGSNSYQRRINNGGGSVEIVRTSLENSFFPKEVSMARQQENRFLPPLRDGAYFDSALLDKKESIGRLACAKYSSSFREFSKRPVSI